MKKVREKLNAKLRKSGGFTLVEMLIVVAIIAILIAISIPMMTTNLEKARHGVDEANKRSAIGLASALYLTGTATEKTDLEAGSYKYYIDDATHQGQLAKTAPDTDWKEVTPQCKDCKGAGNNTLSIVADTDGSVTATWKTAGG